MKVLFVSIGTYGLLSPLLGAAAELARRGDDVLFLTHQRGARMVDAAGFRRVPRRPRSDALSLNFWSAPPRIVPQFHYVRRWVDKTAPDAMVADHFALGAITAARASGVPVAVMGHPTYLLRVAGARAGANGTRIAGLTSDYDQAAEMLGLPPASGVEPFLGDRYLLRSVPAFEIDPASLPERVRFVGACLSDDLRSDEALNSWIARDPDARPIAVIQIEKLLFFDPIAELLAAIERAGLRTAAALGNEVEKHRSAARSAYVTDHLPDVRAIERAAVVISTGQPTAVLGAIRAGLPNIILDFGSGATELLAYCEAAGIGAGVSPRTPELAEPLLKDMVADDAMRSNVARVQQAFAAVDSFAAIADVVHEMAAEFMLR